MTIHPASNCVRAREEASARLDGELSELEEAHLAAHLRECPACSAYAQELTSVAALLRSAPLERPELRLWLPRSRLPVALRTAPARYSAAAAVVVVAAALSFAAGRDLGGSSRHAGPAAAPQARPVHADVVERQVLGMLRDDQARRPGRLIFI